MGAILLLGFATLLVFGPQALNVAGHPLGALATSIMTVVGVGIYLLTGIFMVITKLYVRTKASQAFVRTGMGGRKVVLDGGALVIPFAHEMQWVTLEMLKLAVKKEGTDALITSDNLRADIHAEFFVKCQADDESINNAARSFGDNMSNHDHVTKLIENKLVNALRTAAAKMSLQELNSNRDEFLKQVTAAVTHDISHNGLSLESVSISKLDQTDPKSLNVNNIFDAQGMATISKIVQERQTERNKLEREGEQARTQQDVETRKQILTLEQDRARAEAEQGAAIAKVKADNDRASKEASIVAARQVELAEVQKIQQLEIAKRGQQQQVEVAERTKQQAITVAEQELEVAQRGKQKAVAAAEAERANAEALLATAEASREKARQGIKTVEVEAAAERDKRAAVIAAEANAETQYLASKRSADAVAYATKAKAEGDLAAADAAAQARTKQATADAEARKLQAEGDQAIAMVPVEVAKAQVQVESSKVDVLQRELQARSEHGAAAQGFELAKLRIEMEGSVRIATAQAMATVTGKVTASVYGTPEDVAKMNTAMLQGMGLANAANGFFSAASEKTLDAAGGIADQVSSLVAGVTKRVGGKSEETNGTQS